MPKQPKRPANGPLTRAALLASPLFAARPEPPGPRPERRDVAKSAPAPLGDFRAVLGALARPPVEPGS